MQHKLQTRKNKQTGTIGFGLHGSQVFWVFKIGEYLDGEMCTLREVMALFKGGPDN